MPSLVCLLSEILYVSDSREIVLLFRNDVRFFIRSSNGNFPPPLNMIPINSWNWGRFTLSTSSTKKNWCGSWKFASKVFKSALFIFMAQVERILFVEPCTFFVLDSICLDSNVPNDFSILIWLFRLVKIPLSPDNAAQTLLILLEESIFLH